ncbi:MAG: lactonase family protein [Tepidisphaerales bacterium]
MIQTYSLASFLALMMFATACAAADGPPKPGKYWVFVGTYTSAQNPGLHLLQVDTATGDTKYIGVVAEIQNPTFLAVDAEQKHLYAAGEVGNFQGKPAGFVSAFSLDRKTGQLKALGSQSSGGRGPCHVSVDAQGKNVLVANYSGGSIAALPLNDDGSLKEPSSFIQHTGKGPNPRRQEAPHAHGIYPAPSGDLLLVPDLGLDKIMLYRLDSKLGQLKPNDPAAGNAAPGAGPRHLAFNPSKNLVYCVNEMASTVTTFAFDPAKGSLTATASISTLPPDFKDPTTTAEIFMHPNGKFLYASNRGHDSIAVFAIDPATGALSAKGQTPTGGKQPRNFAIDPTGRWLLAANQQSNNIVVFSINPETGELKAAGTQLAVPSPVCLVFVPVEP